MSAQLSWRTKADYEAYKKMRNAAVKGAIRTWPRAEAKAADDLRANQKVAKGCAAVGPRMPLIAGCTDLFFDLAKSATRTTPTCPAPEAAFNNQRIAEWNNKKRLADQIRAAAESLNEGSNSAASIQQAITQCDAYQPNTNYYVCVPEGQNVVNAYNSCVDSLNAALRAMSSATDLLLSNGEREHAIMKTNASLVQMKRQEFETHPTGGGGTTAIDNAHNDFAHQESVVRGFVFGDWVFGQNKQKVAAFWASIDKTHADEAEFSAITELDRLRNEYSVRNRPTPRPMEFTQYAETKHFMYQMLNSGDYNWSLLRPVLLQKLEEVYDILNKAGIPVIRIESVYRNPARNDSVGGKPLSRHQYGDSGDFQVFDNNADGSREDDWKILYDLIYTASPDYQEPRQLSGVGHVHADWRGHRIEGFDEG